MMIADISFRKLEALYLVAKVIERAKYKDRAEMEKVGVAAWIFLQAV